MEKIESIEKITHLANGLGITIFCISLIMMIYGSFLYVQATADKDVHQSEKGKLMIINAGIGSFVTLASLFILKLMNKAAGLEISKNTNSLNLQDAPWGILIGVLSFVCVIGIPVLLSLSNNKNKGILTILEPVDNMDENSQSNEPAELSPRETELLEKVHNFVASKEKTTLVTLRKLIETNDVDENISSFYSVILNKMDEIKKELETLDIETLYALEENITSDLIHLYENYMDVNNGAKEQYKEQVINSLSAILSELENIQEKINQKHIHKLRKILLLIEKRYK